MKTQNPAWEHVFSNSACFNCVKKSCSTLLPQNAHWCLLEAFFRNPSRLNVEWQTERNEGRGLGVSLSPMINGFRTVYRLLYSAMTTWVKSNDCSRRTCLWLLIRRRTIGTFVNDAPCINLLLNYLRSHIVAIVLTSPANLPLPASRATPGRCNVRAWKIYF